MTPEIDNTIDEVQTELRNSDRFSEVSAVLVLIGGLGLLVTGAIDPTLETLGLLVAAASVLGFGSERLWRVLGLAGVETPDDQDGN